MTQEELDRLWREFVLTSRDPEGFHCLRGDTGDHVIQEVPSGVKWERKLHSLTWVMTGKAAG